MAEKAMTILDTLEKGTAFLERKGVPEARRSMQLLAAHVLGCDRMALYMDFDKPVTAAQREALRGLALRRAEREPVAYLTGEAVFFRRVFRCDERALVPRPETEELAEKVLPRVFGNGLRVADVGTGGGALGITLALELGGRCAEVVLADVSAEALALARENAGAHGVEAVFHEGNLLDGLEGGFHLIVANLPYIGGGEGERAALSPEVLREPHEALFSGKDGLDLIREFVPKAAGLLAPGGLLAMEIGRSQAGETRELLERSGFTDVSIENDLSGIARFPFARIPSRRMPSD